ncbi:MAG: glycosyltransferase family protein [Sulfuricella sp.]|nr:glycosyltransferase family protein [Sulfuricella sp.]
MNSPTVTLDQAIQIAVRQHQAGHVTEAESIYQQVLQVAPNHPDAWHLLGVLAHQAGRHTEAVELIGKAIGLNPDMPAFHNNIALAHLELGNLDEAIAHWRKTIRLKPDHAGAYNSLGNALTRCDALNEAIESYQKALALKPDYAEVHNNLGIVLKKQGRLHEALECYRQALTCKPAFGDALNNQGVALQALGRVDEAIACFRTLLAQRPEPDQARYNLSLCLLLAGDYAAGLEDYESRFSGGRPDEATRSMLTRLAGIPAWENQELQGKTLLLWAEQGLGDTIMMLRYLPLLVEKQPGKILVACDSALTGLVETLPEVDEAVTPENLLSVADCDYHCPMMSLPQRFGTRLATIPNRIPYLTIPPALRDNWYTRLSDLNGLKVGLVWAGNRAFAVDAARSLDLQAFASLLNIPGISYISLQKGESAAQLPNSSTTIHDWMTDCQDFLDTAALLENLDLIVSVDTAVAHLAGALGKPVWLLNRFESEWRWLQEREDSPWYPTLRIFRQPAPGDWTSVIMRLGEELARVSQHVSPPFPPLNAGPAV